jgi:hypothetical protein
VATVESDGPWWVHCRCGALNGSFATREAAQVAVLAHPPVDRCVEVAVRPWAGGRDVVPAYLLGDDRCAEVTMDRNDDGWSLSCACGALDGLQFPTREDAQDARDDHLEAEDHRSRALFDDLAEEALDGPLRRG